MSERSESSYDMFISQARANRAWVEGYLPMSLTKSAPSCAKDLLQPPFCPRLGACGERSVGYLRPAQRRVHQQVYLYSYPQELLLRNHV